MNRPPIFLKASVRTECDVCDYRFDPLHGGVCDSCNRILCIDHLHGSWLRRLRVDLGAKNICVECRAGVTDNINTKG
jgi:hypothetical protein